MKIIQVYQTNPFEDGQGGGVRYVKNLLSGLYKNCEEILFFGIGDNAKKINNIKLFPVTSKLTGYINFLLILMIKLPFLNLKKYDIVHVHRLYFAIPFIIFKPRLKIVCSLHGRTFSVFESKYGRTTKNIVIGFFKMIEKYCIRNIDALVPVSQDVINSFNEKYSNFENYNISLLGSMFDFSKFKIMKSNYLQDSIGHGFKFILFIGRLSDVKNIDFLIELWSEKFQSRNDLKLIIAGDGEEAKKLLDYSNRLCQINQPIFLGEIKPNIIPELISSAQVCVLCSKHEASPTIVKESLSLGIPIITNEVGDVNNFIVNGKNGYVIEKKYEDYSNAINYFISKKFKKETVFKFSKEKLKRCSVSYICDGFVSIYKLLL